MVVSSLNSWPTRQRHGSFLKGVEYIKLLASCQYLFLWVSQRSAISSSQGDEKIPFKSWHHQGIKHHTVDASEKFQGPSTWDGAFFLKTPVTKNRGFSICNWWVYHPPQPEPSNQTFTKTSKPRQVPEAEFGEPGFIPPKKNQWCWYGCRPGMSFFLFGWCFFSPTVFVSAHMFFFSGCMMIRIRLWGSYDCDTVILEISSMMAGCQCWMLNLFLVDDSADASPDSDNCGTPKKLPATHLSKRP